MKPVAIAIGLVLLAGVAKAADPVDPVRQIMEYTKANWSGEDGTGKDYFDPSLLDTLYSRRLSTLYREAAKYPVFGDEGGSPFDYDVITSSQDGCPLEDVTIAPGKTANGATDVAVSFKLMACFEGDPIKDTVSTVHFTVIEEGGRPVIDDVLRAGDGEPLSLAEEMKVIAVEGKKRQAQP